MPVDNTKLLEGNMDKKEFVSVVVPTYNRRESLKETLESLSYQNYPKDGYEIIVIDDGSTDGTFDAVKEIEKKTDVTIKFFRQENKGPSEARNYGIKESAGDFIFFVDSDVRIDKGVLEELIYHARNKNVGAAGPKTYFEGNSKKIWCAGAYIDFKKGLGVHIGEGEVDRGQYDELREVEYLPSCVLLTRRDVINEVGIFNQSYFIYGEDSDWCLRANKLGYKILYVPFVNAHHSVPKKGKLNNFKAYHENRCRFIFMKKNASKKQLLLFYLWFFILEFPFWIGYSLIYHRDLKLFLSIYRGIRDGIMESRTLSQNQR